MRKMIWVAVSMLLLNNFSAYAEQYTVPFPKDYETDYLNYLSVDRKNNRQTARLFANITAMVGVQRFGDFPDGSVLVMEISNVKKDAQGTPLKSSLGRLINDGKYAVYVMEKNSKASNSDNWIYTAFSPSGTPLDVDIQACKTCHAAVRKGKQVFSFDHLEKSELSDYIDRINKNIEKRFIASAAIKKIPAPTILTKKADEISITEDTGTEDTDTEDTENFSEHNAINEVIRGQLLAFREKNIIKAYNLAAPQIRENFHNSEYFMHIVRVAYPQLLNFKTVKFPELRTIDGDAFSQIVIVQDKKGTKHKVRYLMLKVSGQWKIAGCSVLS